MGVSATVLRRGEAGDADGLTELFLASRREALPYLPELHGDEETRAWMGRVVLPECAVWVAEVEGVVAGFVAVAGEHVEHLYVRPGWQRRGIGRRLLGKAKGISPQRLDLWAFQRNLGARAFYEGHGFVAVEFGDGSGNEEGEPDVRYEWRATGASDSDGVGLGGG